MKFCPVPPQLCTGKSRRTNRAAQLAGHCTKGGTRSVAANHNAGEIVVVSGVVSGNRVSQASSTRLTQLKPGARGSSKAGGCIEVCTRLRA